MSKVTTVFLACLLFVVCQLILSDDSVDLQLFVSKMNRGETAVEQFFDQSRSEDFSYLQFHDDLNVSIYSAWLDAWRRGIKEGDPNLISLRHEFLGFLTAKLGMHLPSWWKDEVLAVDMRGECGQRTATLPNNAYDYTVTDGIRHSNDIELIEFSNSSITVIQAGDILRLRESLDDNLFQENPSIFALTQTKDGRWISGTADIASPEATIFCSNSEGEKLWKSRISICRQLSVGNAMPGVSTLAICANNKFVAVFWVTNLEIILDVFDLDTGNSLLRFTTLFKLPR